MLLAVQLTEHDPFPWDAVLGLANRRAGQPGKTVLERSKLTTPCKNAAPSLPAAVGETESAAHTEDWEVGKGVARGGELQGEGRDPGAEMRGAGEDTE